ncbi:citrate/2-methylcitrate synthase [Qiania dongpingensis]|uniref:Citrate synthase n=1 Tax=Qiania dongpingensis TaxID=2763669 RepID=A0A7G9G3Q1_9FIRM|nr:citrate/2-methylcitrate synthase [Qiania dongpingensis]QNM05433.1 citrate/2-methylcitrate synthase [Qiania dongpingensis]
MSDDERFNPVDFEFDTRLDQLVEYCKNSNHIDLNLYTEYDVKRGLRDSNGKGVLTGLTEISDVIAFDVINGRKIPANGRLYYQGYNVKDLINGFQDRKFGFEETTYLLLFGSLPTHAQMDEFLELMGHFRNLPDTFVRDIIMKAPSKDIMNSLQKSVLTLYTYDRNPDDVSIPNVLKQSLHLIAQFPLISVYAYQAYRHYHLDESLVIRNPKPQLSTAENILRLLRPDGKYTELEAKVLDVALVIHAEHGGGNNSSFTTHVVSSTGTDTYSAVTASLGSLKGPKHGGANLKVQNMFADLKKNIPDWSDEDAIREYLQMLINKEAFDRSGLIYGIGHAVYTKSDPRAVILKKYAKALSEEKGRTEEYKLYTTVERLACQLLSEQKQLHKAICANVDFYSGFVYNMLGLPNELFTPIFAISRISGWCAHRIEELVNSSKIIRPAYKYVGQHHSYVALDDRK